MKVLVIDNFDSFVYNLAQVFGALGAEPVVVRNDASIDDLVSTEPDAVVISPGPGDPTEAGVSEQAITVFSTKVPVLGVCLGHQCIATAFGAKVSRAKVGPRHGKRTNVSHDGESIFEGLPSPFVATRYHSLAIEEDSLPAELNATAFSEDGTIMGVRHRELPVEGVQFHPESILCDEGPRLLANFIRRKAPVTA